MIIKHSRDSANLILLALFCLPILINPVVSLSFDEIYLQPKVWWIYGVILPSALLLIWRNRNLIQLSVAIILLGSMAIWLLIIGLFFSPTWLTWLGPIDRADGIAMHLVYLSLAVAGLLWSGGQKTKNKVDVFCKLFALSGCILALSNISQQLGLLGVPGDGAFIGIAATMFGGILGNRGYMGGALALLLPLAVSLLINQPRVIWHWPAVTIIAWALAGSDTRGAWLAGTIGMIWLLVCQPQLRRLRFWWPVFLGLALIYPTQMISGKGGRSFQSAEAVADSSGRSVLWKSALYGIAKKPLTGWGAPALWKAMNARPAVVLLAEFGVKDIRTFRHINVSSAMTELPSFIVFHKYEKPELITMSTNKVHNEYMDYALTYGLPAAMLFAVMLAWAIWSARITAPGFSAAVLAYGIYLFTWPEVVRFAPIAWFMIGICLALGQKSFVYVFSGTTTQTT